MILHCGAHAWTLCARPLLKSFIMSVYAPSHGVCTESYGGGAPSGSGPKIGGPDWQHISGDLASMLLSSDVHEHSSFVGHGCEHRSQSPLLAMRVLEQPIGQLQVFTLSVLNACVVLPFPEPLSSLERDDCE